MLGHRVTKPDTARSLPRDRASTRALALTIPLAVLLAVAPVAARAQTTDPELSCVPEAVSAGALVTCRVTGVAASRTVTVELRDDATVLADASGVADAQGRAAIDLVVPTTVRAGTLTIALVGTDLAFPVTVTAARPSGVSAGVGPSSGDVARVLPAATVLALAIVLAAANAPGLRRRSRRPGSTT